MIKTALSQEETSILQAFQKTSPLILIRFKALALLLSNQHVKHTVIANTLNRTPRSVSRWVSDFNKQRLASIFTGHSKNTNASKLTPQQKAEVQRVLQQPPSDDKLPVAFWKVPALKEYLKASFGVIYESDRSYHYLLEFCGFSFKYPDTFDLRRDEGFVKQRMIEIKKEIAPMLNSPEWQIYASDETRIQLEAETRRAWLKTGEKTILRVERKREAQNYMGFLNLNSGLCNIYELDWQNQKNIISALIKFIKLKQNKNKRICIIWDNAKFHKGKLIREALFKGRCLERLHLINLPPYAPDKNPIEHVWDFAKGKLANRQFRDLEVTKRNFKKSISNKIFAYQI